MEDFEFTFKEDKVNNGLTPEEASARAKKGWETRKKNMTTKKSENKSKNNGKTKKIGGLGINIFSAIMAFILGACASVVGYSLFTRPHSDKFVSGNLAIHFLELGNKYTGDCTFIQVGDCDILIDAGSNSASANTISNYINQYVTDNKLEFVIATHAHEDHIGAFTNTASNGGGIFARYQVDTIIDFPKTSKEATTAGGNKTLYGKYLEARNAEVAAGAVRYSALECYQNQNGAKRIYDIANGVQMEILYNYYYENTTSDENNYSVCVMINQGERHFLFTGDLEKEGEQKLVAHYQDNHGGLPHCTLFKGGHHGSPTSTTNTLLAAITPEIVCVCCCAGTSEYTDTSANQFPSQEFINRVAPYTKKVYVTTVVDHYVSRNSWSSSGTVKSMNGNIVVISSRSKIDIECSHNNTQLKDTEWFLANRTTPPAWAS